MTVGIERWTPSRQEDFLSIGDRVYENHASYIASGKESVLRSLNRPEFRDAQAMFMVSADRPPFARVMARVSPVLCDGDKHPLGMLSFFEATDDTQAVGDMFSGAFAWLRRRGVKTVVGPIDGDTWHKYRLNLGPFDSPPFLMEPYNPPYYPGLWQATGFTVLESYYSKVVTDLDAAVAATQKIADRAARHGYTLRAIRMEAFDEELSILHDLTCRIFAKNCLYTDISLDEFRNLYLGSRGILDPDLVLFARSPDGRDIGFVFAFPDFADAVSAMGGRGNLAARLAFLLKRIRRPAAMNVKTLGVIPEFQRTGVALMLMNRIYSLCRDKGYHRANLCLIREGNPSGRLDGDAGAVFRRYALYRQVVRETP
jgi:GNAT superfamily N-acetyltransferase